MKSMGATRVDDMFSAHANELRAFVARQVGDSDADDIVADVFLEASRCLRRCPEAVLGIGWFMTVARRRVIDHWRSRSRKKTLHERLAAESRRSCLVALSGDSSSSRPRAFGTDVSVSHHDLEVLDQLLERQRRALILRYIHGYSVGELAERLGCSYPATESLLARSRRSLARALDAREIKRPSLAA